jgi:hypothetical protein
MMLSWLRLRKRLGWCPNLSVAPTPQARGQQMPRRVGALRVKLGHYQNPAGGACVPAFFVGMYAPFG